MSAQEFRRLALSLPGAVEVGHIIGVKISPSFGTFNPDSRSEGRRVSAFDQVSHKGTYRDRSPGDPHRIRISGRKRVYHY
jgi:hypothetical protein